MRSHMWPLPVRQAEQAAAGDVALGRDEVADGDVPDVGADLDDGARELVAERDRRLDAPGGPAVPEMDVEIRPADARRLHLDDDVRRRRAWLRHLLQRQPRLGRDLPQRLHGGILAGPSPVDQ